MKYQILYVLLAGRSCRRFSPACDGLVGSWIPTIRRAVRLAGRQFFNVNSSLLAISAVLIGGDLRAAERAEAARCDRAGQNQAINLGVAWIRQSALLLGVTVLIAIATALVGPISFLGLIIANLSRQLFKTYKHTWLIFGSAVLGMIVLVGGQLVVEHGFSYSIPISVLITIGGGLYFLILLFGKGRQRIC
ncbi:MAG: iron chelate uptake ABC transporter family permease subunit [Merdibacter sp.]